MAQEYFLIEFFGKGSMKLFQKQENSCFQNTLVLFKLICTKIHFFITLVQNFYFSPGTGDVSNQITHFLDQIRMPYLDRHYLGHTLVQRLDDALQASELAELRPKLHMFGSLCTHVKHSAWMCL